MYNAQSSLFEEPVVSVERPPLAERMRPKQLADLVGQTHLVAKGSSFYNWLQQEGRGNILLYGPPGCGKTSLAHLVAQQLNRKLVTLNAVLSNVAELRERLRQVEQSHGQSMLFIDEIHRFNRSQQDALLPFCEQGRVQLVGATTRNPAFYLISPLVSRCYLFELKALETEAIVQVLTNALVEVERGLGALKISATHETLTYIAQATRGDLRRALNLLEYLCLGLPIGSELTLEKVQNELKRWQYAYDARDSDHYDCISAFIKSVRGSDPDAALYWLARMLKGGEDPLYIARRLIILASEDVGLADSRGLNLATSAYLACEKIGLPEGAIPLAHVTLFLALSPKSNSAYKALNAAKEFVKSHALQIVPDYLQERPTTHSEDYLYAHNFEANVTGQPYWDEASHFYEPKAVGAEQNFLPLYKHRQELKEKIRKQRENG